MINIAFIINQMWGSNGGTEGQLLMLLNKLDPSRFRFYLVCLGGTPWIKTANLPCESFILDHRQLLSFSTPERVMRLKRYLVERRVDIAQTFFFDADLFGVTAAHFAHTPVVVASRRNIGHFNDARSYWMLKRMSKWVDHYLCNSQAAANMVIAREGAPAEKTRVIYNGLDLNRFSTDLSAQRANQRAAWGIGSEEILIGLSAHLRHVKNVPALLHAAARLLPEFSIVKFVVIGEGPLYRELNESASQLGIAGRFKFVGAVQNIVPCLAAFDIGVLCSHAESFSNALIEYMAAGLPIIASDVGGSGEAISHEKTGLLYAPGSANGLEDGLRRLITNGSLGKKLGATAREVALSKYSQEASLTAHAQFYERVLSLKSEAKLAPVRE